MVLSTAGIRLVSPCCLRISGRYQLLGTSPITGIGYRYREKRCKYHTSYILSTKSDLKTNPQQISHNNNDNSPSIEEMQKGIKAKQSEEKLPSPDALMLSQLQKEVKSIENSNLVSNSGQGVQIPKEPTATEVPSKVARFFLGKYVKYMETFNKSLETEMPDTYNMMTIFKTGFKGFVIDFRDFLKIAVKLSLPFYYLEDLNRQELQVFFDMPRRMVRVFPLLLVASLPLGMNVAFPFGYFFPRQLMCYHFWTPEQRLEFGIYYLTRKIYNARPTFRCLQSRVDEIDSPELNQKFQSVLFKLGSGVHPSLEEVIMVKDVFAQFPLNMQHLKRRHVKSLLRLHNRSALLFGYWRLKDHARYLRCMDCALRLEGLDNLSSEDMQNMVFLRGINPSGMSDLEIRDYLQSWLHISLQVDEEYDSLILHLPILLAYNLPTNLSLIARR